MLLVEFYFVGLMLPFANSNYEYDYDPNSNYDPNALKTAMDQRMTNFQRLIVFAMMSQKPTFHTVFVKNLYYHQVLMLI